MAEVEFAGERFTTADKIGLMPLMRFAKVAKAGADAQDMDGLAALYDLLQQCIDPADWARFEEAADRTHAEGDELMGVIGKVFEALSERPTSRPSDSSAGPATTPPNSGDASYLQVVKRLEDEGRPSQAAIVLMANEEPLDGLTVLEVCDLAYVLLLDQLERQTLADRQVAAVFMAAGGKDVDLPSLAEQRRLLDEALVEQPRAVSQADTEQMELRRALGVA